MMVVRDMFILKYGERERERERQTERRTERQTAGFIFEFAICVSNYPKLKTEIRMCVLGSLLYKHVLRHCFNVRKTDAGR